VAPPPAPAPRPTAGRAVAPALTPEIWAKLYAEDRHELKVRLAEAGFPPEVVRAMLTAELGQEFAAKRRAIDPEGESRPFWKNAPNNERSAALRRLSYEQHKSLRALFGNDGDVDPESRYYTQRGMAALPPDHAAAVMRIRREFDDRRTELFMEGLRTPADRTKLNALEKEQLAAIASALGPEHFATYELWNGSTANQVRSQLATMHPTEAEFLNIYRTTKTFNDQYGSLFGSGMPQPTSDQVRQRQTAYEQMNAQIKAALGPERAAEYERATDYSFQQTSRLVERLELPPATAHEVWQVQKDMQKRINELASAPAERATQLAALSAEATSKLTTALGPRGFEAYRRNGGDWMTMFDPPRPPAKK
jgi:hypothetical protein